MSFLLERKLQFHALAGDFQPRHLLILNTLALTRFGGGLRFSSRAKNFAQG